MHRSWLLGLLLLLVVAGAIGAFVLFRPGGMPLFVRYYRVVDEDTIVIQVSPGTSENVRLTMLEEHSDAVVMTVQAFTTAIGMPTIGVQHVEITVDLAASLGNREVRDTYHVVDRRD